MPDLEALRAVEARLAAGETGREMDRRVGAAVGMWPISAEFNDAAYVRWLVLAALNVRNEVGRRPFAYPEYEERSAFCSMWTTSLDAAVTLTKDGQMWQVDSGGAVSIWQRGQRVVAGYSHGKPAAALTLACIRAEIARLGMQNA